MQEPWTPQSEDPAAADGVEGDRDDPLGSPRAGALAMIRLLHSRSVGRKEVPFDSGALARRGGELHFGRSLPPA